MSRLVNHELFTVFANNFGNWNYSIFYFWLFCRKAPPNLPVFWALKYRPTWLIVPNAVTLAFQGQAKIMYTARVKSTLVRRREILNLRLSPVQWYSQNSDHLLSNDCHVKVCLILFLVITSTYRLQTIKNYRHLKNIGLRSRTRSIGGAGSTSTPEKFGGRFFGNFGDRFFGEIAKQTSAKKETWSLTSIDKDSIIHRGIKQVTVANEWSSAD